MLAFLLSFSDFFSSFPRLSSFSLSLLFFVSSLSLSSFQLLLAQWACEEFDGNFTLLPSLAESYMGDQEVLNRMNELERSDVSARVRR